MMETKKLARQNLWQLVSCGEKVPQEINCLVEIPKGGTNKYEYSPKWGAFRLDRVLYEAVFYPTEYGIIPQTWNEKDKDPLDIMVLSTFPTFPGCVIPCRPVGVIRLLDTGEEDDKILAVPVNDPRFEQVKDLSDLPPHFKKEISNFWENYSELQKEKKIKVLGWSGKEKAWEMIKAGREDYKKQFPNL
ncbi:MAG: inorganic diphosphatase [Patescibacteria group bacterium]